MKKNTLLLFFLVLIIIALVIGGWFFYDYKQKAETTPLNLNVDNDNILTCNNNKDCIPNKPLMGVLYICEENRCIKKPLGNPASTYCQKERGILESRIDIKGGEYMACLFDDGSECEEWKFFKKECSPGDFNPRDNIWEGKVIKLRGAVYDDYFEMLNGEKVGIDSDDPNIKDILTALQDKEGVIKFLGKIEENVVDVGKKRLNVEKILDLGEITFEETSKEESIEIALESIKNSDDYITDKGGEIELVEIFKVNCPYCWTLRFSYFSKIAGEKLLDVLIQEGEVRDIASVEKKLEEIRDCAEFAMVETCTSEYDPVCAKIQELISGINESSKNMKWRDFSNACTACTYSGKMESIVGYRMGKCEKK